MSYQGAGLLIACPTPQGWEALLGKRNYSPFRGHWSIPGGGKEEGDESFLATALRETAEEIGNGRPVDLLFRGWLPEDFDAGALPGHRFPTPLLSEWHTFLLALTGKVPPEQLPVPGHEFSALAWWPLQRLPAPTHPGVGLSARHFGLVEGPPAGWRLAAGLIAELVGGC